MKIAAIRRRAGTGRALASDIYALLTDRTELLAQLAEAREARRLAVQQRAKVQADLDRLVDAVARAGGVR